MYEQNKDGKYTAIGLVKTFFSATLQEMKTLPLTDRNELASAVARDAGIAEKDCTFTFVAY